jgi:hypothetical protein
LASDRTLAEKKFAEAEPSLLSGYDGMKARQGQRPVKIAARLKDTVHELVRLYEAWGKAAQAARWKREQAELDAVETEKK